MEMRSLVADLNSFLGGEAASEGTSWSKGFSIDGENVRVLESPSQYYDTLLTQIQGARRNIVLSALYLGTGKLERRLIRELGEALEREENLRITLIFDFNRAHREYTCSDSGSKRPQFHVILPLLQKFGRKRIELKLYEMPPTNAVKRVLLPPEIREALGVYHVKFCVVDDTVILTGANLSEEYFENRQDRYIMVSNAKMTSFIDTFSCSFTRLCHDVNPDGSVDPPELGQVKVAASLRDALTRELVSTGEEGGDTLVYPFVQHAPAGVEQESLLIPKLLDFIATTNARFVCASLLISSPYPSFRQDLTDAIIAASVAVKSSFTQKRVSDPNDSKTMSIAAIVSAATSAHGFGGSRGTDVKAIIPKLHDQLLADSLIASPQQINPRGSVVVDGPVDALKWGKEGWSFHSKGVWAELVGLREDTVASITCVGSSNMGERSLARDMELGFLLVTQNKALQNALHLEMTRTVKYCQKVPVHQLYHGTHPPHSSVGRESWLHSRTSIKILSKLFRKVL